jgi:quercetin dioxygenase-like cupin family protein
MKKDVVSRVPNPLRENLVLVILFVLCLPVGTVRIWRSDRKMFVKLLFLLLGLPFFVVSYSFLGLIVFAAFLPPLDLTVGDRKDRTIINSEGNYSATFVKTAGETNNAYELIKVDVEARGGNGSHYHSDFEEHFTVLQGTLTVYIEDKPHILMRGETMSVPRKKVHYYRNETDSVLVITVKTTPAKGLEKTLRVAYGLINSGQLKHGMTENPWHMCLLLGYSGTYLEGIPPFIQEPIVNSLAKIAQWQGEDKPLEGFYR